MRDAIRWFKCKLKPPKKVLCVTPCFDIFHTNENYREVLLEKRFGNNRAVEEEDVLI